MGLDPLPPTFAETREGLHRLAEGVIAPARKPENEIALFARPGGFGTRPFDFEGAQWEVRTDGAELVVEAGSEERRAPITTLRAAGELARELLDDESELDSTPLAVDEAAAWSLAAWYAFGDGVLSTLLDGAGEADGGSPVHLWPEHFDIAIELGAADGGHRANYGLSPGDENHAEPYLYVGPWSGDVEGELWNAEGFTGAELSYAELIAADDQRRLAIDFCRRRKEALDRL